MSKQNIIYASIAVAVIALGVIAYLALGRPDSVAALTGGGGSTAVEIKPTDMVHGKATAPVTIVEYASMTCPHCAAVQKEVIPQLTKDYIDTGKVKLIFREFPLDGAANMASAVARCLSGDNYFAFIDLLFANQAKWIHDFDGDNMLTREDILHGLTDMGRIAGLSADKVMSCADDKANLDLVKASYEEAQSRYMVDSTPTFIIQGTVHKGELTYETMKGILDPLLANK